MNQTSNYNASPSVQDLDFESNLILGLVGGGIAMLVSAIIWGTITYFLEYQISWMAIGVGFFVGIAVRKLGRGNTLLFGISSAVLSLIGCLLGNFFLYAGFIARQENVALLDVFFFYIQNPFAILELFRLAFDVIDLLFYALAAYVGFRVAMEKGKKPEIIQEEKPSKAGSPFTPMDPSDKSK